MNRPGFAAAALLTAVLSAQPACSQPAGTTMDAFLEAAPTLVKALTAEGRAKLTTANTGASADLQGLATALNDLIPDLKLTINGNDATAGDTLRSLGITYSPRINKVADIGLSLKLSTPDVYGAFEEQGLITGDQARQLESSLGLGDRTDLRLTFSRIGEFLGQRYGRSLGDYEDVMNQLLAIALNAGRGSKAAIEARQNEQVPLRTRLRAECREIWDPLREAINSEAEDATAASLNKALQRAIGAAKTKAEAAAASAPTLDVDACEALAEEYIVAVTTTEAELDAYVVSLEAALTRMGLFSLPDLVEQQPQLQLVAGYTNNDDLAGPDQLSVKLSWETSIGSNSVNDLIGASAWSNCQDARSPDYDAASCIAELENALGANRQSGAAARNALRFALNAEYRHRDRFDFVSTDPAFDYSLGAENAVAIASSLYWKRFLSEFDPEPYVFEASLEYEMNDSDVRNDRAILKMTASRNISKGLGLSLGLAWANRPEFRGATDKELSAKLGLSYKLSPL